MSGAVYLELCARVSLTAVSLALLLTVIRIIRGPTLADQVLGLDTLTVLAIGMVAAFAVLSGFPVYLDIAVALALLGFVATAAFARYLLGRDGREQ